MSNTELKVPAHIAARAAARKKAGVMSALAQALASSVQPPRISIKGSRFRLVENSVETPVGIELDVVIIGANPAVSKIFYAGEWDPNAEDQRPDCASADGKRPDSDIANPVCDSCLKCPNNVLGSKIIESSGAKSKLCSDLRYLAVVPASDPSKVYALTVTVTAMKSLRQFTQTLNNYGVEINEVVTQLSFDEEASFPKVVFNKGKFLPEKAIVVVESLMHDATVLQATREDVQGALPAPESAGAAKLEAPAEEEEGDGGAAALAEADAAMEAAAAAKKRKAAAAAKKRKAATAAAKAAALAAEAAEAEAEEEEDDDDDGDLSGIEGELADLFG